MIRLLGRQTSGNVQKVIFCLEELGLSYTREDYGRQFGNTLTDAYRKLNPNAKVPTMIGITIAASIVGAGVFAYVDRRDLATVRPTGATQSAD